MHTNGRTLVNPIHRLARTAECLSEQDLIAASVGCASRGEDIERGTASQHSSSVETIFLLQMLPSRSH